MEPNETRITEPVEVPNTDFTAIRGDTYTTVIDENGTTVVVLPPNWSLFDIELWCQGYTIGYVQGFRAGKSAGRKQVSREITSALGIYSTPGTPDKYSAYTVHSARK
jgi:hypothetical protein